jgi:hypothetical protein
MGEGKSPRPYLRSEAGGGEIKRQKYDRCKVLNRLGKTNSGRVMLRESQSQEKGAKYGVHPGDVLGRRERDRENT